MVGVESKANDMMRSRVVRSRLQWSLTSDLSKERRLVREQVALLTRLHCAGRVEYVLQACACGWDSEMEHGDTRDTEQTRSLTWLASLGHQHSVTLYGQHSDQAQLWQHRITLLKKH